LDNRGLQKVSETPYYTRRDDSRTLETRYSRQRLHQKLRKVARAKHEVRLERPKMIEEYELVEENLQQALRGDRVRVVNRSLQAGEVAVFECCRASVAQIALD
jgi:hypothetical protein